MIRFSIILLVTLLGAGSSSTMISILSLGFALCLAFDVQIINLLKNILDEYNRE